MKPNIISLYKKVGLSVTLVNFLFKYMLGNNRHLPCLIHFTSRVRDPKKLIIIENESSNLYRCLSESNSVYIQAKNKVELNSCLNIAPGVKIISSNHDVNNLSKHVTSKAINIGKNVWIGANSIILPNVIIGNNVVIGAGSVVTKSIPSNSIAVGNPCRVIRKNVCS